VQPSFVPPPPIRELRDLTRRRKTITGGRTREIHRLEKRLEDAGIELSSVASRALGVSGRAMIDPLIAGKRDAAVLANLAQRRLRKGTPELTDALPARFRDHHALLAREMLARIHAADATIVRLSAEIEARLEPFREQVDLLSTSPGAARRTAEVFIAGPALTWRCSARRSGSPPGRAAAPDTTSPPADANPGAPANGRSGCVRRWSSPPTPPPGPRTATSPGSSGGSPVDAVSPARTARGGLILARLRPVRVLIDTPLSPPRTNRGRPPGAPLPTRAGLPPAGLRQLAGRNTGPA
jgi:hypothetical protein